MLVFTARVVTAAVAVVLPAATVTEVALNFAAVVVLEARVTTMPDGPAGAFRVSVAVAAVPPITEVGDTEMVLITAGRIDALAVTFAVPRVAVNVAAVEVLTAAAVNVNVPELLPAEIVSEVPDSVAELLEELSETVAPLAEAGPLRFKVPVTTVPSPP